MAPLRLVAALAIATTACVQQPYSEPSTFPEPTVVSGPPGGEMDPQWQAQSSGDYADATVVEPSADPSDPGYAMGTVTDAEIDTTLEAYGEWIETDDYGLVWRPYATDVGADFTPYESGGSWIWTDWGWTFSSDWDWGWLPFHYGQWGWFDDYWAWVPDYQWSPAQVDWRGGGGYVGWRPQAPAIRDHRTGPQPYGRDHRVAYARDHRRASSGDSHWRFAAETDFGKPHIRAHLFKSPAEGLRLTSVQTRPALRGNVQAIRAASLMRNRFANGHVRSQIDVGSRPGPARRPTFDRGRPPVYDRNPSRARAFDRAFRDSQPSVYQPSYGQPSNAYTPPSRGARNPAIMTPDPVRTWQPATPSQPPTPSWRADEPAQGTFTPAPTPPAPTWHGRDDAQGTFTPMPQPSPTWGERGGEYAQGTFTPAPQPATPTWHGRDAHPQGTFTPTPQPSPTWGGRGSEPAQGTFTPAPQPPTPTWHGRDAHPQGTFTPSPSSPPVWGRPSAPPPPSSWSPPSAPSSAPSHSWSPSSAPSSPNAPSSSPSSSSSSHDWRGSSAPSSSSVSPSSGGGGSRGHHR